MYVISKLRIFFFVYRSILLRNESLKYFLTIKNSLQPNQKLSKDRATPFRLIGPENSTT